MPVTRIRARQTSRSQTTRTPVISACAAGQSASADASCEATVPDFTTGVTASDNCDTTLAVTQDPAAGTVVGPGVTSVTITVTDDAGNTDTCTADFTVTEDTDPVVSVCPAGQSASADSSCEATVPDFTTGVTASDNCDTTLTVTQDPAAGTTVLGVTSVTIHSHGRCEHGHVRQTSPSSDACACWVSLHRLMPRARQRCLTSRQASPLRDTTDDHSVSDGRNDGWRPDDRRCRQLGHVTGRLHRHRRHGPPVIERLRCWQSASADASCFHVWRHRHDATRLLPSLSLRRLARRLAWALPR
jgi:hypothetical protein